MIGLINFSDCELSNRNLQYGGRAGEKRGVIYKNEFWFLKFPKNTIGMRKVDGLSYVTSPISEYIGSHIYKILGYDVHDTLLGICYDGKKNKVVCACKDFINDDNNELLIPYTSLRNDTNPMIMEIRDSNISSASNINEIVFQLSHNTVLSKIEGAAERFWDVVLIDVLINNNDRNEDNWGVIKNKIDNTYRMAPIYDCGNSFYGKTSEERIVSILEDEDKLYSSAINGITAYEDDDEKRISAINILGLIHQKNPEIIKKVYDNFIKNYERIENFIISIPNVFEEVFIISNNRKEYYLKNGCQVVIMNTNNPNNVAELIAKINEK